MSRTRTKRLRESTPAKVNLSLLVGPVRRDGYHDLFTVFAPLDLRDDLDFRLEAEPPSGSEPAEGAARETGGADRAETRLQVDCPGVPAGHNLITRALDLVSHETGWPLRGSVVVKKRIPIGAGLGGGSSDAACALRVGAQVVAAAGGPALDDEHLAALALRLGADVPFFLAPSTTMATGVGEVLEPLELPPLPVVVLLPPEPLFTAEVYQTFDGVAARESPEAWQERRDAAEASWRTISAGWSASRQDPAHACQQVAGLLYNDLERAAFHLLPELTSLKALIERQGVLGVLLSGSGPTLFGVCASAEEARRAARRMQSEGLPARALLAGNPAS